MTHFWKKWLISPVAFLSNRAQWLIGSLNQEAHWHWRTGSYSAGVSETTCNVIYYIFLDRLHPGQAFGLIQWRQPTKQPTKHTSIQTDFDHFSYKWNASQSVSHNPSPYPQSQPRYLFPGYPPTTKARPLSGIKCRNINVEHHLIKKKKEKPSGNWGSAIISEEARWNK